MNAVANILIPDVEPIHRRAAGRSQRPCALLTGRNRSESPVTRSKSRPSEIGFSTPNDESYQRDLESLEKELKLKSGVLKFGSQSILAHMDDFINEGILGSGTCSLVYKMRHRSRKDLVMAVKHMRRSNTYQEENKRIMMDLNVVTKSYDCANIVECYGIFFTTNDVWICMEVMSTCLDKLLKDLQRPFPERVLGKVTVAITTALDYLKRKHNMMHRDVKPSNMLLSYQGVIKLCDFGISGKLKDSIARSRQLGCIGYMSPERLETPTYDVRADIWSLGISLLELATGSFPYKGTDFEFAIMSKIISEPPPTLPYHIQFTDTFRYFVELCLKKDHHERPKYRSLMSTEFFLRHNVAPYDVLNWLQGLPLTHLQQANSPNFDKLDLTSPTESSSTSTDSPNSACTISPDVAHAMRGISLDQAIELKPCVNVTSTKTASVYLELPTLDVTLVAAPTTQLDCIRTKTAVPHLPHQKSLSDIQGYWDCLSDTTNNSGLVMSEYNLPRSRESNASTDQASVVLTQSSEPTSQLSSGYGSAGSDGSPGCSNSRTVNPARTANILDKTTASDSNISTNTDKLKIVTEPVHKQLSDTFRSSSNPFGQLIRRFQPNTPPTGSGSTSVRAVGSNRSHETHRLVISSPVKNGPIATAPLTVPPRQARTNGPQSRSASVGAQLHRTPAQRWQVRPNFRRLSPNSHTEASETATPMSTQPQRSCIPLQRPHTPIGVEQLRPVQTKPEIAPQQYHHHYFHYYHQDRPGMPSGSYSTCSSTLPSSNQQPLLTVGSRLTQRLHTHPLPRQLGSNTIHPRQSNTDIPPRPPHTRNPVRSTSTSWLPVTNVTTSLKSPSTSSGQHQPKTGMSTSKNERLKPVPPPIPIRPSNRTYSRHRNDTSVKVLETEL